MSLDTWAGGLPSAAEAAETNAWLRRVMQSAKNKAMIARLEDSLHVFVADREQTQLPFPPRSAFHRKVCYLVARRYGLAHRLEQYAEHAQRGEAQAVRLVLLKTPHSAIPGERFAQLSDASGVPEGGRDVPKAAVVEPQKVVEVEDEDKRNRPPQTSTTFLRRPRSVQGKAAPKGKAVPTAASGSSTTTLKSISEEDYRKARARIFKNPSALLDDSLPDAELGPATAQCPRIVRMGVLAKGPVEGSTGFDRRRNRRITRTAAPQAEAQRTHSIITNAENGGPLNAPPQAETGAHDTRQGNAQLKNVRDGRLEQPQSTSHTAESTAAVGTGLGTQGAFNAPTSNSHRRTNPGYTSPDPTQTDRQDPDFDRRYIKWAVRAPPAPTHPPHPTQPIPVPVFSQLLYPYAVQGTTTHMHAPSLHLRSVNSGGELVQQGSPGQYHSAQVQHVPSGAMMFQHVAQNGGLTGGYDFRDMGASDRASYDILPVDRLNASYPHGSSSLQHRGVPPPLTRNPSPAYGLDSTVDFPPLP